MVRPVQSANKPTVKRKVPQENFNLKKHLNINI